MNFNASNRSFSLVEVVLALAICVFGVVSMVGLLGTGIQASRESEDQIQAANLASQLIARRAASPTNHIADFAIPESALTNAYGNVYRDPVYIGFDGKITKKQKAAYQFTCMAGTNQLSGSRVSQVYLMLSWPPLLEETNTSMKHYELFTYLPIR